MTPKSGAGRLKRKIPQAEPLVASFGERGKLRSLSNAIENIPMITQKQKQDLIQYHRNCLSLIQIVQREASGTLSRERAHAAYLKAETDFEEFAKSLTQGEGDIDAAIGDSRGMLQRIQDRAGRQKLVPLGLGRTSARTSKLKEE